MEEIYNEIESQLVELCTDPSNTPFYAILECVSLVSTYLEVYRIGDKRVSGKNKKTICKEIMMQKIIEIVKDDDRQEDFINIINYSVDHIIESLINFAKNNKIIVKGKKCIKSCI
tara:strand:+ start:1744 stop:2088 length:345 start_codon:yes stop_codon:yes gene_type:complete